MAAIWDEMCFSTKAFWLSVQLPFSSTASGEGDEQADSNRENARQRTNRSLRLLIF
jgi:hypothetical protein